ncbi:monooxygenase [Sporosarcina sp. UB5]|uniref:monooxygenase n=1 Tax=Sporosarcina sp. UB5 TaxID=3047463 RepID=UPI003D7A07DF
MPYLLQVDFPFEGPFGEEMTKAFTDTAKSINNEEGVIWKIWTEYEETKEAGGVYLFETEQHAENYLAMHTKRLNGFGITDIQAKIFNVNESLSRLNNGPITHK